MIVYWKLQEEIQRPIQRQVFSETSFIFFFQKKLEKWEALGMLHFQVWKTRASKKDSSFAKPSAKDCSYSKQVKETYDSQGSTTQGTGGRKTIS